jgi:hypothetical protein
MTEPIKLPGDFPSAAGVRFEGLKQLASNCGNPASNCRPRLSPRLFLSFVSQYQPQKPLALAVGHAKRLRLSLRVLEGGSHPSNEKKLNCVVLSESFGERRAPARRMALAILPGSFTRSGVQDDMSGI